MAIAISSLELGNIPSRWQYQIQNSATPLTCRLEKLSFIRYLNNNGLSEEEKYTIENAVMT
jgi:hypothetical protein